MIQANGEKKKKEKCHTANREKEKRNSPDR
jgi:hypothetical protein